jgi:glycosyltransferase involved in cell wall biosynthesis
MRLMSSARAVIVPSACYETFGRAAAEALAVGTPVICSANGAVAEIVEDGRTGYHFPPSNPSELSRIIDSTSLDPASLEAMRVTARHAYEARYTAARAYDLITSSYARVISRR